MDDVACLVPARAGSTRVRNKNLQEVGGRTLLERAIDVALSAFGEVWVSTDERAYADLAVRSGARVPALRPPALAQETTPMDDVIQHALREWLPERTFFVLVQPTSPFTTTDDLLGVVDALRRSKAASAQTAVGLAPPIAYALAEGDDGLCRALAPSFATTRSQDLPRLFQPTGGAFARRMSELRAGEPLVGEPIAVVEVPSDRALDIDTADDLERARGQV